MMVLNLQSDVVFDFKLIISGMKVCDPDWDRAKQRKAKIQEALASKEPTETTTKDTATS